MAQDECRDDERGWVPHSSVGHIKDLGFYPE